MKVHWSWISGGDLIPGLQPFPSDASAVDLFKQWLLQYAVG